MVMERYRKIEFQVWDLRAQRNPMQKKRGKRSLLEVWPVQQMVSEQEKNNQTKMNFQVPVWIMSALSVCGTFMSV